jgi:NADH/NAD ratio-sensing transcriptional regulator Rex
MNLLTNLFTSNSKRQTVRFAVVGLGNFAQTAILPAFANATDKAKLAALVTGDPEKAKKLGRKYSVPTYDYEQYEALLTAGDISAVYIAVPNSEHRKYTEAAARAGVHELDRWQIMFLADLPLINEGTRFGKPDDRRIVRTPARRDALGMDTADVAKIST